MPLPTSLLPLVKTRRFWTDFLWITEPEEKGYPELSDCKIDLPLPGGNLLSLSLDSYLCYFSLNFTAPNSELSEIAWDDQAHWHPHVLRWQELESLCRVIELQDPEFSHPGILLLFLHRFAPICIGDDIDFIVAILDEAWGQLGVFTDREIQEFVERINARDAAFRWQRESVTGAWYLTQEKSAHTNVKGLYTLRHPEHEGFPSRQWDEMIRHVEGTLSSHRGVAREHAVLKALGPRTAHLRIKHSLYLHVPMQDSHRPLPNAAGYFLGVTLNRLLSAWALGHAESSGSTSIQREDGEFVTTETSLSISIRGDLEAGVHLIRETLWWSRVPKSTTLTRGFSEDIPLQLEQAIETPTDICVQLASLRAFHWGPAKDKHFRLDRVPLTKACWAMVKSALAQIGAHGPDENGWFHVEFKDGGLLDLCLPRIGDDADLDTITLRFKPLSELAVQFVSRLSSAGPLILLPLAIAPSGTVAEAVNAPWPPFRVLSTSAELCDLLGRGPFAWWSSSN